VAFSLVLAGCGHAAYICHVYGSGGGARVKDQSKGGVGVVW
jgi:hypothetical protein